MIMNKSFKIIKDFWCVTNIKEKLDLYGLPLIFALILWFIYQGLNLSHINQFYNDINNSIITIATLLSAFSVASLTIITTSSNENVEKAKCTQAVNYIRKRREIMEEDIKNSDGIPISYYQLILIRNSYNIMIQFLLLIISIVGKFIAYKNYDLCNFYMLFELWFLFHSIITQVFAIMSLYYLVWKPKR